MPKGYPWYACALGCTGRKTNRPRKHPAKWDCPRETTFDPERSARFRKQRGLNVDPGPNVPIGMRPAPPTPAATAPPATRPAYPPAAGSGKLQELVIAGSAVSGAANPERTPGSAPPTTTEFLLDEEHSETLYETLTSWGVQIIKIGDSAVEYFSGMTVTPFEFEITEFDRNNFRTGFSRRLATKFCVALGAKTLQEAQETVDTLAVLGLAIHFFAAVGEHGIKEWGPKMKLYSSKKKAAAKAKKEEAERQKREEAERAALPPGTNAA